MPKKINSLILFLSLGFVFTSCNGTTQASSNSSSGPIIASCNGNGDGNQALPSASGINVLPISLGNTNSICGFDVPCTSVKICTHGSTINCQTITNILIDTGSYGLRIFQSAINTGTVSLSTIRANDGSLAAECEQFGSANTWGPVRGVDVVLGSEPVVSMTMQVIDSTFKTVPSVCQTPFAPVTSPSAAGFNGILGVGLGEIDCGSACVTDVNNQQYFSCSDSGSTCQGAALAETSQILNPVFTQSADNNGVIFQLPSISPNGLSSTSGHLILGIGTRSNNAVSGSPTVFNADNQGYITTVFQGTTLSSSFLDSGSNGLFFPSSSLASCSSFGGFYCPSTYQCLAGQMQSGSTQKTISFGAANLDSLGVEVANDATGQGSAGAFDWGLPFFFGRTVYTGMVGKSSTLGPGPLWAF